MCDGSRERPPSAPGRDRADREPLWSPTAETAHKAGCFAQAPMSPLKPRPKPKRWLRRSFSSSHVSPKQDVERRSMHSTSIVTLSRRQGPDRPTGHPPNRCGERLSQKMIVKIPLRATKGHLIADACAA